MVKKHFPRQELKKNGSEAIRYATVTEGLNMSSNRLS